MGDSRFSSAPPWGPDSSPLHTGSEMVLDGPRKRKVRVRGCPEQEPGRCGWGVGGGGGQ